MLMNAPEKKTIVARKWLFVCSANYIRSPTAEHVARSMGLLAESCGTDRDAATPIRFNTCLQADVIVCMELEHLQHVRAYGPSLDGKIIVCWNLPDEYRAYCQPELVSAIQGRIEVMLSDQKAA